MPNKYGIPSWKEVGDGFAKIPGKFYVPILTLTNLYAGAGPLEAALNPDVSFNPDLDATGDSRAEKFASFFPPEEGLGLGLGLTTSSLFGYYQKNIFLTVTGAVLSSITEWERLDTDHDFTPGKFFLKVGIRAGLNVADYLASYSLREWKKKRLETLVATPKTV